MKKITDSIEEISKERGNLIAAQQYVKNIKTDDQLEWNGSDWFNSFEGLYKPGFWRVYL